MYPDTVPGTVVLPSTVPGTVPVVLLGLGNGTGVQYSGPVPYHTVQYSRQFYAYPGEKKMSRAVFFILAFEKL